MASPIAAHSSRAIRSAGAWARKLRRSLMRSYSLSGEPDAAHWRVSVKREADGAAGAYVSDELKG